MREILFRGKANSEVREGEWIYGSLLAETTNTFPIIARDYDNDEDWLGVDLWDTVEPHTVGQYTGLTDKNGKKIFEGDILEFSDRLVSVFWHAHLGCWDSNFLKYTNQANEREDMSPCRWEYRAEVVGNIYDNLELQR